MYKYKTELVEYIPFDGLFSCDGDLERELLSVKVGSILTRLRMLKRNMVRFFINKKSVGRYGYRSLKKFKDLTLRELLITNR